MLLILTVTLPLFFVILAGYVAAKRMLISNAGVKGLTGFVFHLALPVMLFRTMILAPVRETFDGRILLAYLLAGFAVYAVAACLSRWWFRCRLSEQALQGISATFGNTVFIGIPVAVGVFGAAAALPMALFMAVENAVLMPLAVTLLELARTGMTGFRQAPLSALGAVVRNPVVMSVVLGALASAVGLQLPAFLESLAKLLSGAAVPCALFALGATLAGMPVTERLVETGFMVTFKLAVYPVFVLILMSTIPDVDPVWMSVALLAAAMPMGANVYLLAERYDTYVARVSTAVLLSTVVSIVTISILAVVLARIVG